METFLFGTFGAIIFDIIRIRRLLLSEKAITGCSLDILIPKNRILFEIFLIIITAASAGILCIVLTLTTPSSCIVLGYTLPSGTIFSIKGFPNNNQTETGQAQTNNEENFEEFEEDDKDERLNFTQYIKYAYSKI